MSKQSFRKLKFWWRNVCLKFDCISDFTAEVFIKNFYANRKLLSTFSGLSELQNIFLSLYDVFSLISLIGSILVLMGFDMYIKNLLQSFYQARAHQTDNLISNCVPYPTQYNRPRSGLYDVGSTILETTCSLLSSFLDLIVVLGLYRQ